MGSPESDGNVKASPFNIDNLNSAERAYIWERAQYKRAKLAVWPLDHLHMAAVIDSDEIERDDDERLRNAPLRRAPWAPSPATDPRNATISARALVKARGTVEDLCRSYFPIIGLPVDDILCFADSVYFVAASLYEIDELNEAGQMYLAAAPRAALEQFLEGRGLLSPRVRRSLARGDEYWRLERELVAAWRGPPGDDYDENRLLGAAMRASSLKSFDYEVLTLIVLHLTNKPCDDALLDFLNLCFHLVEIEDDLKDYADDCAKNSFNLYRAFVRRWGPDAPIKIQTEVICYIEHDYLEKRAASLSEETLRFHLARNEQQGGAGPAMAPESGEWNIPPPLAPLRRQENEHCCP